MHDLGIHNSNFHCILQLLCQPGNNNNQLTNQPTKTKKNSQKEKKKVRKETTESLETTLTPLEGRTSNNYSSFDISEKFPLWFYTRTRSN